MVPFFVGCGFSVGFVDGDSLADMLIEVGMAVRYDGGKKAHKFGECMSRKHPMVEM